MRLVNQTKKLARKFLQLEQQQQEHLKQHFYGDKNGYKGYTKLFIYPGYKFKAVDNLITNFHLPQSSLLMLVSAFIGYDNMKIYI